MTMQGRWVKGMEIQTTVEALRGHYLSCDPSPDRRDLNRDPFPDRN